MPFGVGMGVIMTGSMEPNITTNDLIVVKNTEDYQVDDVVVYQSNGSLVVHRIIEVDGDKLITQGDANNVPDEPIEIKQVKGEVVKVIGGVGNLIKFTKSPIGVFLILGVSALLLILSYKKEKEVEDQKLNSIKEEIRKLRKEIENK